MAQRLPTSVVPSHYAVTWTPDLEAARFTGTEQIDVTVAQGDRRIVLNALELADPERQSDAGRHRTDGSASPSTRPHQQAALIVDRPLRPGPARIELGFSGTLNDTLAGLYRSRTADQDLRRHAVRGDGRPPGVPVLRRAGVQSHVRHRRRRRQPATWRSPTCPSRRTIPVQAPARTRSVSRRRARSPTYLVALLVGDFECAARQPGRHSAARLRHAWPRGRNRVRARSDARRAVVLPPVLRDAATVPEARSDRRPRLHGRRDGERRRHRLPRNGVARRRAHGRRGSAERSR